MSVTNVHGVNLISEDDAVVLSYNRHGKFENQSIKFWIKNQDQTAIDIGAYTGLYTILALKHGAKQVLSYEPVKATYKRMISNLIRNDVEKTNLVHHNAAIMNTDVHKMTINFSNSNSMNSAASLIKKKKCDLTEEVNVISKIEYYDKVSIIKIDVEGSELNVLSAIEDVIQVDRPKLIIETLTDAEQMKVMRFLSKYDYRFELADGRNTLCY